MKGTEKQIKWAEDIKARLIGEARYSYEVYKDQCEISPEKVMAYFEKAAAILADRHDEARWWIDNRQVSVLAEIDEIVNALYAKDQATTENTENTENTETDWAKIFAEEEVEVMARNEELREYYQGIVDDIDAHGGPRVWDLPGPASMWRGDGKCHTEEMRYNDAKQWLAAHPQ